MSDTKESFGDFAEKLGLVDAPEPASAMIVEAVENVIVATEMATLEIPMVLLHMNEGINTTEHAAIVSEVDMASSHNLDNKHPSNLS
jgi:hypothetical protein